MLLVNKECLALSAKHMLIFWFHHFILCKVLFVLYFIKPSINTMNIVWSGSIAIYDPSHDLKQLQHKKNNTIYSHNIIIKAMATLSGESTSRRNMASAIGRFQVRVWYFRCARLLSGDGLGSTSSCVPMCVPWSACCISETGICMVKKAVYCPLCAWIPVDASC